MYMQFESLPCSLLEFKNCSIGEILSRQLLNLQILSAATFEHFAG